MVITTTNPLIKCEKHTRNQNLIHIPLIIDQFVFYDRKELERFVSQIFTEFFLRKNIITLLKNSYKIIIWKLRGKYIL